MWDSICAKAMAKDRQNRYATASEFKNDLLTFMNGGVPMAAAFNPLTDLTNMKARKQAEMTANTVAMTPAGETTVTQAFNPVTGQFEAVPNPQVGCQIEDNTVQGLHDAGLEEQPIGFQVLRLGPAQGADTALQSGELG